MIKDKTDMKQNNRAKSIKKYRYLFNTLQRLKDL